MRYDEFYILYYININIRAHLLDDIILNNVNASVTINNNVILVSVLII